MVFKDWIERFCINTGSLKDSDKKRLAQPTYQVFYGIAKTVGRGKFVVISLVI